VVEEKLHDTFKRSTNLVDLECVHKVAFLDVVTCSVQLSIITIDDGKVNKWIDDIITPDYEFRIPAAGFPQRTLWIVRTNGAIWWFAFRLSILQSLLHHEGGFSQNRG